MRTGPKPSRAVYPCQRMAAANASAWLGAAVVPLLLTRVAAVRDLMTTRARPVVFGILLSAMLIFAAASPAINTTKTTTRSSAGLREEMLGTGRIELSPVGRTIGNPTPSDIFVVQGTTGADEGFARMVQMIEHDGGGFYRLAESNSESGIVGPDDVVIIKVNSQWNQRGGTNTDLLHSIVRAILDHPAGFTGEVIIADNGQAQYGSSGSGGSLNWQSNNALDPAQSAQTVAETFAGNHRVSTYLWDTITKTEVAEFTDGDLRDGYVVADRRSPSTGIIVSYPKFTTRYGTRVSFAHGIWNEDSGLYNSEQLTIINVPVLKSHMIYGVTGAVKHYMGVVSNKLTSHNAHRKVGSGGMGTQMVETRVPDLNVVDAIWINAKPRSGPSTSYSTATETNTIAASRDAVAIDTWAALHVLLDAAGQLGHSRTNVMDPRTSSGSKFSKWLALSAAELQQAGFAATTDLSKVNIRIEALQ